MHLVYLDESGNSGANLAEAAQPIFVLAAIVVPEAIWSPLENDLMTHIDRYFPPPRPDGFELHATAIRRGDGHFRSFKVAHRLEFLRGCFEIAQKHEIKLIYRTIVKKRFKRWVDNTFGSGVFINPHVVAFPLVARVVDEYLKSLPGSPLGIFIADENHEIIGDVEKAIRLLRFADGALKLGRIIEKGFFIDSRTSLVLQLCDLCAFSLRRKEEAKAGLEIKEIDRIVIDWIEPLIYRGEEAFEHTLEWVVAQHQKKERPGDKPGSV